MTPPRRGGLQRLVVEPSAITGSRDFRHLFIGQGISQIGSQLRIVALPYQAFLLTHSSAVVGLPSLVQFVPLPFFSLVGAPEATDGGGHA